MTPSVIAIMMLAQSVASVFPLQSRGLLSLAAPLDGIDLAFEARPAIRDAKDAVSLRRLVDGFAIITCTQVTATRQLTSCKPSRWEGQNATLDAVAMRAVQSVIISREQVVLFKKRDGRVIIALRFSKLGDPPAGPCPFLFCATRIPVSLPPPRPERRIT